MPKKHNLSDEEVADLKEAFSMFDIDGDGESFSPGGGRWTPLHCAGVNRPTCESSDRITPCFFTASDNPLDDHIPFRG